MKAGLNKSEVVMIPTNEKSFITKNIKNNNLAPIQDYKYDWYEGFQNQHLYFLSYEKIKVGDFVVCKYFDGTFEIGKVLESIDPDEGPCWNIQYLNGKIRGWEEYACKKIITTTDSSLTAICWDCNGKGQHDKNGFDECETCDTSGNLNLPQPSQQFIQKYIEEYNKGNIITEVMVEYEKIESLKKESEIISVGEESVTLDVTPGFIYLKINSKDNTIAIHLIEEIYYSRSEVIEILHKRMEFSFGVDYDRTTTEQWASENL